MRDASSDEELLERLQCSAFEYLLEYSNPANGLVADTSRPGAPASIAVVGFALSCYPVAVEAGWMTRADAASRTLATLRFLQAGEQGEGPRATGYRGFYYHFLDMQSGERAWSCEVSLIDTALLMAGVLTAGAYFDGAHAEAEIRSLSDALYRRVEWEWGVNGGTVSQGWKPECGFLHYGWEGYNEATVLYVLGMGSPTHPLPAACFKDWTRTYQWEHLLGEDLLYAGPLFTHLFSHAWIDFRGIRDAFMREKRSDYFENTRRTIALHREYAARNPHGFKGYGRDFWGITAGDGPAVQVRRHDGSHLRTFGYMARGAPFGPDDGTIAPWAMAATVPFGADAALAGTRHLLRHFPEVCRAGRFCSGFNPTLRAGGDAAGVREARSDGAGGWLSDGWYGLDQGLLVMMVANHRTGLVWNLLRGNAAIRAGLTRAGFTGGWLS
jgi:hypothetical protein